MQGGQVGRLGRAGMSNMMADRSGIIAVKDVLAAGSRYILKIEPKGFPDRC